MIALGLRFLAGRFHATPWGRHVNEGANEWPPAPWRLLRSLIAAWKSRLDDDISRDDAEAILRTLAEPPEFHLPSAGAGHTRHYMPWFKKGPGDKTLVFDAFVALPPESEVIALWPEASLDDRLREVLAKWLRALGYFGRAESWCEARLLAEAEAEKKIAAINCRPLGSRVAEPDMEIVRVLCADPAGAFADTHTPKTRTTTGRGNARQVHIQPFYEPDWHLCGETLWLHGERWSDPPGSRWVRYARRADCFRVAPRPVSRTRPATRPQVARFALDSTVLPVVTQTLPVAEDARRNLMGIFGRRYQTTDGQRANSPIFSGKDDDGTPGKNHGHAFYLPTDEDHDGRLDHLTIVAADGFGPRELSVIDSLREIKSREREESGHPLRVLLLALDRIERCNFGPLHGSREWISATPFVAPRYPKARGTKRDAPELLKSPRAFLIATLREELAHLLIRRSDLNDIELDSIEIHPLEDQDHFRLPDAEGKPRSLRPIQFKRFRQKRSDDGGRRASGAFRLVFPKKIAGPIALGHSSHFGLGLFVPVTDS